MHGASTPAWLSETSVAGLLERYLPKELLRLITEYQPQA